MGRSAELMITNDRFCCSNNFVLCHCVVLAAYALVVCSAFLLERFMNEDGAERKNIPVRLVIFHPS